MVTNALDKTKQHYISRLNYPVNQLFRPQPYLKLIVEIDHLVQAYFPYQCPARFCLD